MIWDGSCCEEFSKSIDEGFIEADFLNNIFQIKNIPLTRWDKHQILEYDDIEFKTIDRCPFCGKKPFEKIEGEK
jgi:hypothetical protein